MGRSRTSVAAFLAVITCAIIGCDQTPERRQSPTSAIPPGKPSSPPVPPRTANPQRSGEAARPPSARPATLAVNTTPSNPLRITSPTADRTVTTNRPPIAWSGTTSTQEIQLLIFQGPSSSGDPFRVYRVPAGATSWGPASDDPWPDGQYTLAVLASSADGQAASDTLTITIRNCPADLDRSGSVTVEDLYVYLNAWLAGRDPLTNQTRPMTMDDAMAYINQWFAGCAPGR